MMKAMAVLTLILVFLSGCGGGGPEAAGESVPRVDPAAEPQGSGR